MKNLNLKMLAAALPLAALVLAGCGTPTKYYWGNYEELVYANYAKPGAVALDKQIQILQGDAQKAQKEGRPLPPGFHAQLGYLYAQQGSADQAKVQFETEKQLFPESTVLMDRLIANMARK
ncbi:DUF4810 domain-containing protein [Rhizomicrobium electricum]|jgi:hypothetical protein|nr:DUF4810 domain-containing protein [Rhizomicrobium electricum]NIJ47524.1 hypothetical protein [Rhizomicrobium electricum]